MSVATTTIHRHHGETANRQQGSDGAVAGCGVVLAAPRRVGMENCASASPAASTSGRFAAQDQPYEHLEPVLRRYASMDPDDPERSVLRQQLVEGYLPVAQHIARRYAHRGEPLEDLVQVASLGLVEAINRYRPERCEHFLGFAIPTIAGNVKRYFRDTAWSIRVPRSAQELRVKITEAVAQLSQRLGRAPRPSEIATHLSQPVEDVLTALQAGQAYRADSLDELLYSDHDGATVSELVGHPDTGYALFDNCHSLAPHVAALPTRERSILIMRFYHDMTQSQIAQRFGISQMHVSRILSKTLSDLRAVLTTPAPQPTSNARQEGQS